MIVFQFGLSFYLLSLFYLHRIIISVHACAQDCSYPSNNEKFVVRFREIIVWLDLSHEIRTREKGFGSFFSISSHNDVMYKWFR